MSLILPGGHRSSRAEMVAPAEFSDAVMMWARENGCAPGHLKWNPVMRCWEIRLALKPGDPRLRAYQEGMTQEREEVVFLHRHVDKPDGSRHLEGMTLEDLGVSGLRELLDRGSLTTGRGEHRDLMEAVRAVADKNQALRDSRKSDSIEFARLNARDNRRAALGTPTVAVGIDIQGE